MSSGRDRSKKRDSFEPHVIQEGRMKGLQIVFDIRLRLVCKLGQSRFLLPWADGILGSFLLAKVPHAPHLKTLRNARLQSKADKRKSKNNEGKGNKKTRRNDTNDKKPLSTYSCRKLRASGPEVHNSYAPRFKVTCWGQCRAIVETTWFEMALQLTSGPPARTIFQKPTSRQLQ